MTNDYDHADKIEVRVLRGSCADTNTCPKITDVGHPEFLHAVAVPETDPAILKAHASHIGPGEVLVRLVRAQLPELGGQP